ncbi:MAG: GPMC system transcriptional regulator [Desulfuromonas thiophila]|nr:GPMC system transcriptional regulator [Desulfuromonas thiophila]MDY0398745.1 GPMC system transcriptional regulator [Desulfuromonas thiophila]
MTLSSPPDLKDLLEKINSYGKESIEDILHVLAQSVSLLTGLSRCRIYLEDLTKGRLVCAQASGRHSQELLAMSFPISTGGFLISHVYSSQEEILQEDMGTLEAVESRDIARRFHIRASWLLPLVHAGRSIGVLCVDSGRIGQLPPQDRQQQLKTLLQQVIPTLDIARKYHQQLLLARRIDEGKNREAALYMMKSAVHLVENLTLASVLVPSPLSAGNRAQGLQILASYSEQPKAKKVYEDEQLISLSQGESLLSRYIADDGTIIDERFLEPLYFSNLAAEPLQKRYLTEELGLKSLYAVPRYAPHSRRIHCVVNYYSDKDHNFTEFERGLLDAHAEMAERVIREIGGEHMEIQVLAEINDLLQERFDGLQPFLNRVLSKATELIGADTGSIALVREQEDGIWLMVEDSDGTIIGAKSKEWLKKNIPPIRVGGHELPPEQRSLTGLAAFSGQAKLVANTDEVGPQDFYRPITNHVKSELAVPILSDDKVVAVICLDSFRPHYFTDEHRRILRIIERMIARYLVDLQQIAALTDEVRQLRRDVTYKDPKISSYKLGNIIGNSRKAGEVVSFIQTVTPLVFNRLLSWLRNSAEDNALGLPSIFITGETGSGKEFVFNNIYSRLNEMYQTQLRNGRELPVKKTNIAAYSGDLTYSELFGHKRGAFTGAHTDRKGILEEAHGGVVFLDEIGDADPKTQVQLLRFLDNGSFVRLGENQTRFARVLLIAATNKDLPQLIARGLFREDLYHRLSELTLEIPSLNERREDIPDLSTHFLGKLYRAYKHPDDREDEPPQLSSSAQQLLKEHHYSGNMRELRSILLRALFFSRGKMIGADNIRRALATRPDPVDTSEPHGALNRQLAQQLFDRIVNGEENFWTAAYEPYSRNRLARDTITDIIDLARQRGARTMPRIAALLKACDPASEDAEQRKLFYRFKNFLYKTIRI